MTYDLRKVVTYEGGEGRVSLEKGDLPGHEFRGNQYTGGSGVASSDKEERIRANVALAHSRDPAERQKLAAIAGVALDAAQEAALKEAWSKESAAKEHEARLGGARGEYAQTAASAKDASTKARASGDPSDHAKAAELHGRAATMASSDAAQRSHSSAAADHAKAAGERGPHGGKFHETRASAEAELGAKQKATGERHSLVMTRNSSGKLGFEVHPESFNPNKEL
jgi:hypothetical protein